MEVLFCLIHRKSSSGVRLHTQNTKKWTGVRRLEVWPVVSDEGEDERWTPWLSSSEATAEGEGRDGQRGLNLVTPVLHLQLRQSSAYSPTETARTLQFYWFLLCLKKAPNALVWILFFLFLTISMFCSVFSFSSLSFKNSVFPNCCVFISEENFESIVTVHFSGNSWF